MLKGLGTLAVRALPLLLLSAPAWAGNTLYLDNANAGQPQVYTDSDGTFSIGGKATGLVSFSFTNSSNFFNSWGFEFQAPTGSSLAIGNYDNLQRWPFQGPLQPGADYTAGDSGCDDVTGRFVVQAISTDGNDNVTSLAVDFQLYCDGASTPLTGAIRYNSTLPYPLAAPTVDAGANQIVTQGTTVTVDGTMSEAGNGTITAYQWTQLSGPSVSLAEPNAVTTTFTAPDVPIGGADVVLQLEVDNSLALSSTATTTIHVANPADPQTVLYFTNAQGQTAKVTPLQTPFTATTIAAKEGVAINLNGGTFDSWTLDFAPPTGQTLQVGNSYDMAQIYPGQSATYPGLAVSGNGACNGLGRFVVLDLQTDGNGNITSFAADFDIACSTSQGVESVSGKIRYNSSAPLTAPWADAGITQLAAQGMTVTLASTGSDAGGGNESITSYQWTQLSGPGVTLSDPTAANPTFSAPGVGAGGADLVFQLTVTNSDGLTSTDTVRVHVANPADPVTATEIDSDQTDPAGLGQNVFLYSPPYNVSRFRITGDSYSGAGVEFSVNQWTLEFVVPAGQNLQTGTYGFAQAYPWESASSPGLAVYYSGNQCVNANGQFTILDVQTDGSGNITAFAADFWQTCDGGKSRLRGKIRYNSSVSIFDPLADAGQYQFVRQGDTVALSASASDAGGTGVTISSYQWTQLSGPAATLSNATAEAPTFTAPGVSLGGADLVFQLTVTNSLGLTSSATVTVHVANTSDPAPFTALNMISDPGDPVGGGQTTTIDSSQATFIVSPGFGNGLDIQIGEHMWDVAFAPPAGQMLKAGVTYDLAQRYPSQSPPLPGLSVTAPGQGCGAITGRFAVLDIRYDIYGNIVSLAADFEQHCNGAAPALHGLLRYNSGIAYSAPFADAGPTQRVVQGATVTLDGSSSFAGAGSETIASYAWTQLSGTGVTLSSTTAAAPTFTAPVVAPGGVDLSFQLTVTNSDGLSGSDVVKVHVADPTDPITAMHLASDQGDSVGQGQTIDATALTAAFTMLGSSSGSVQIETNLGNNVFWDLDFAAPEGQSFQAGTAYEMALNYPSQSPTSPGLSVTTSGGCDAITGRFVVLDIQTNGSGQVTSFAADFEQHCGGAVPALRGKIRYNSAYPIDDPMVDAGLPQQVIQGDTVTLSGASSDNGGDGNTITSYTWTQVSGPSVTLSDPSGATTTFGAPVVPPGGATLVFQLTITSSDGLTSSEEITVFVANPNDPINGLYVQGKPDDITGNVQQLQLQPLNGTFALSQPAPNAITIRYSGPDNAVWVAKFAAPTGQTLHTGTYTGVVEAGTTASPSPGMLLTEDPPGFGFCSTISGQFTVSQISFDDAGNVTQFAADFKQICDEGAEADPPILRGKIRYNSTVTMRAPTVDAGIDQLAYAGLPVTLDGSASTAGAGNITSYSWTQLVNKGDPVITLSDPSAAKPTFTAPNVPAGGRPLSFQLSVTNSLGLSSSDVATVVAHSETDAKTAYYFASDPGDPIGNGTQGFATSDDAFFSFDNTLQAALGIAGFGSPAFSGNWQLDFGSATPWQPFTTGAYLASGQPNAPTIGVTSGSNSCSSPTGQFIIRDMGFSRFGQLNELGMDFIQKCPGASGVLRGSIRYNSPTPVIVDAPTAQAAVPQVIQPGTLMLDGSASFPGWGNMTSYLWQQLTGPRVSLASAASAQASVALPEKLFAGGGTVLTFRLTVSNSLGLSNSTLATVTAAYPSSSLLQLQSDVGDPVGGGGAYRYTLADPAIQASSLMGNGLGFSVKGDGNWMLDFAPPPRQVLKAGTTYNNAVLYQRIGTSGPPALFVGTRTGECKTVTGDFTVLSVAYGANRQLASLAVNFDQHCNGIGPGLHGKLRYHSSLP